PARNRRCDTDVVVAQQDDRTILDARVGLRHCLQRLDRRLYEKRQIREPDALLLGTRQKRLAHSDELSGIEQVHRSDLRRLARGGHHMLSDLSPPPPQRDALPWLDRLLRRPDRPRRRRGWLRPSLPRGFHIRP